MRSLLSFCLLCILTPALTLDLTTGYNSFAADLHKTFSNEKTVENFALSPLSAALVLTLLENGARGETSSELLNAVHLSNETDDSRDAEVTSLLSQLNGTDYEFIVSNKLFIQKGYDVKGEYLDRARTTYAADVENLDFSLSTEAAEIINQWISNNTNQKITNLISPSSLSSQTRLLLANALYFKGFWKTPFRKFRTKKLPFSTIHNNTVDVETMINKPKYYNYHECDQLRARFVELPIGHSAGVVMVIVLPEKVNGIFDVELSGNAFKPMEYTKQRLNVRLPKFKVATTVQLDSILQQLGIRKAFSDQADFSGITETEKLAVSKAVQKVMVDVNEKGVEAAAATYIELVPLSGELPNRSESMDFFVDHPFLFYIKVKDVIVFTGRILDPST